MLFGILVWDVTNTFLTTEHLVTRSGVPDHHSFFFKDSIQGISCIQVKVGVKKGLKDKDGVPAGKGARLDVLG